MGTVHLQETRDSHRFPIWYQSLGVNWGHLFGTVFSKTDPFRDGSLRMWGLWRHTALSTSHLVWASDAAQPELAMSMGLFIPRIWRRSHWQSLRIICVWVPWFEILGILGQNHLCSTTWWSAMIWLLTFSRLEGILQGNGIKAGSEMGGRSGRRIHFSFNAEHAHGFVQKHTSKKPANMNRKNHGLLGVPYFQTCELRNRRESSPFSCIAHTCHVALSHFAFAPCLFGSSAVKISLRLAVVAHWFCTIEVVWY